MSKQFAAEMLTPTTFAIAENAIDGSAGTGIDFPNEGSMVTR
jgi:hypothetical protein